MSEAVEINQFVPMIILLIGLGAAWLVFRFVFKMAARVFLIGCSGVAVVGLLLYLGVSIIS